MLPQDLKKNLNVLGAILSRMDLVTRDEFDVQAQLLSRTRARLEAMQKRPAALEEALRTEPAPPARRQRSESLRKTVASEGSPAHHQIHHSAKPEHWNRNYGEVFAIWEWMFVTLVLPSEEIRKNLILGVGIGAPQRHSTLAKVYLGPLASMCEILTRRFQSTRLTP